MVNITWIQCLTLYEWECCSVSAGCLINQSYKVILCHCCVKYLLHYQQISKLVNAARIFILIFAMSSFCLLKKKT